MKGKFKDIAKDFGLLNEQLDPSKLDKNTTAGDFEVNASVQNEMEKVKIKYILVRTTTGQRWNVPGSHLTLIKEKVDA